MMTLAKVMLIASGFLLSCMVGAGIYQHAVVIPTWFENPPASFAKINQYGRSELRFWIPLQTATLICILTALVLVWRRPMARNLILAALGCYVVVAVTTALYFVPNIVSWGTMDPGGAPTPQLRSAGHRWLMLSWVREATLIAADFMLLITLAGQDRG